MEKKVKQNIVEGIKYILENDAKYGIISEANDRQSIMRTYLELAITQLLLIEFEKNHINYIPNTIEIDGNKINPLDYLQTNGLNMEWISKCKERDISIKFGYCREPSYFSEGKFDRNSGEFPDKTICINIYKGCTVEHLVRAIYHEMQHFNQFLKIQSGAINKENLRMAREFASSSIEAIHEHYIKVSHDLFYIESDADENAYTQCGEIFGINNWITSGIQKSRKQSKIGTMVDYIGESVNSEDYFDGIVTQLVASYETKGILEEFPILKRIYSTYSGRLPTEVLIWHMNEDLENADYSICNEDDIKEMYYEEIFRNLEKISDEDYNRLIQRVDKKELQELLIQIEEYFRKEKTSKIETSRQTDSIPDTKSHFWANAGYIKKGDEVLDIDEFISELDSDILDKKINFKNITYRELLKDKKIRESLPANGIIKLKTGETISLTELLETELLKIEMSSALSQMCDSPFEYFYYHLTNTVAENQENSDKSMEEEIAKYYNSKISLIKRFLSNLYDKNILPEDIARISLVETTIGKTNEADYIEQAELNPKNIEGEISDG